MSFSFFLLRVVCPSAGTLLAVLFLCYDMPSLHALAFFSYSPSSPWLFAAFFSCPIFSVSSRPPSPSRSVPARLRVSTLMMACAVIGREQTSLLRGLNPLLLNSPRSTGLFEPRLRSHACYTLATRLLFACVHASPASVCGRRQVHCCVSHRKRAGVPRGHA